MEVLSPTLQRDVALKIVPEAFALDPDRLARFRREAQVLAALNHPNIAAIYGFEESTSVHALVLELVEGPTLADRIAQGRMPIEEALPIARQIAEALEAAHEHGIIHRDLKPANIKLRPDGAVKVLDFGLAKTMETVGNASNVSQSPTLTSPAMMTGVGMILGTAAYMSPEQAKGRPADKRSDIWGFGCVLYEMLTGKRPFDGEDITEVLGAVVRLDPNWAALSADVPPPVRTLLYRCLVKDRRQRIADIAVARFVIDHQAAVVATRLASATTRPHRPLWRRIAALSEQVLFTITPAAGGIENGQIAVLDLQTGTSKVLIRGGSHAHYVPTGHLIYGIAGTLRAVAFDLRRLEVVGTPAPVLEGVVTTRTGAADVALAANGSLVYVPGGAGGAGRQTVVSVDRQGRAPPLPGLTPDFYRDVKVSPDGKRLALGTQDDVSIYDFSQAALSQLTGDSAPDYNPLRTPDSRRIVFTSRRAGYPELFWRPADGTGHDERLFEHGKNLTDLRANGWSADGKQLLFTEVSASNGIGQFAIERPSDAKMLVKTTSPSPVSPDGHWIAYHSDASAQTEIYVERYPELGNRQKISRSGGRLPIWSRNGRELFFSSLDTRQMLAVQVQSGAILAAEPPKVLFEIVMLVPPGGSRTYDVAPNGRFLIIRNDQAEAGVDTAPQIVVVQNWTEELKRLVPVH